MRPPQGDPDDALLRRTGRRLGLQAAAIVSVIVVLLTTAAVLVVLHSQHAAADDQLAQALARADDVEDPPSGMWLSELAPDGTVRTTPGAPTLVAADEALRRTDATGSNTAFDLHLSVGEYRVQTQRRDNGTTFSAALDLQTNHAERDRLITTMLATGAIGLLLAAAAGAWLGRRASQPLSTALALQRRFVGDASHELRTPLTLLSTRAQLLRRRLRASRSEPGLLDDTDQLIADTQRLAAILDDLLLSADPTQARSSATVDLTRLASEVITEAGPTAAASSITITGPGVDSAEAPDTAAGASDTAVQGSAVALRRAITALVDNAVRHADRAVEVSVRRTHRHLVLEVTDDGRGVDPELTARLFHRFVSTRTTDTAGRRHYGIGLALVSDIAASHGGTVELATDDPSRTIFRVTLPAAHNRRTRPRI